MKYLKKLMSGVVATAMLFSVPLPAAAGEVPPTGGTAGDGSSAESISAFDVSASTVAGGIEGAVVGVEKAASGGYYVLATKNTDAQTGDDNLSSDGLYVYKYDENLEEVEYSYSVENGSEGLGNYTDTKGNTYPLFLDTISSITIADSYLNAPFTQDAEGNIYVAYKAVDLRTMIALSSISKHKDVFPECICDICDTFNQGAHGSCSRLKSTDGDGDGAGETGDTDDAAAADTDGTDDGYDKYEDVDDCPVCNAWHEAYKAINSAQSVVCLVVEKLSPSLEKVAEYKIAYDIGSAQSKNALTPAAAAVGKDGSVYISGRSNQDLLKDYSPVLDFAYFKNVATPETTFKGERSRGFVIKLDSDLSKVTASTYLGGMYVFNQNTGDSAVVSSLAVSDSGRLYAAGGEYSGKIPSGENVFQSAIAEKDASGRTRDAFITELDPNDLKIVNSTYYGGSNDDTIFKLKAQDGCVYAVGTSASADLKVSDNAYQKNLETISADYIDGYVLRLPESLKNDQQFAATYIGGVGREEVHDMDVDKAGNVVLTGHAIASTNYPVTDGSSLGNTYFISILNNRLTALKASSLLKSGSGRVVRFLSDDLILTGGTFKKQGKWQANIEKIDSSLAHADVSAVYRFEKPGSSTPVYMGAGADLNIIVSFDNNILVTGTPQIKLNLKNSAGENVYAVYREPTAEEKEQASQSSNPVGNGTKRLMFSYTVQPGDTTGGEVLQCAGEAVELPEGSSIIPLSGGSGKIELTLPVNSRGLRQSLVYVNTTAAIAVSVKAGVNSGVYGTGTVIPVMVDFGIAGLSANDPDGNGIYIDMNNGGRAYFDSIDEATGCAVFKYTVSSEDRSTDKLTYTGNINMVNGASLRDAYNTEVSKELPAPDAVSPMGRQISIDILAASVKSVTTDAAPGYYKKGDTVNITVEFDKPVTSTGEARLALNVLMNSTGAGYITAPAVSNDTKLVFTYTVNDENTAAGQYLDYISAAALSMADGAELKAASGSPASLNLPIPGTNGSLSDAAIMIDTKAPSAQLTNRIDISTGQNRTSKFYKAGEILALEAQFSEVVNVKENADITIKMETGPGDTPLVLKYQKIQPDKKHLVFTYTVAEGDTLNNATLKRSSGEWRIECEAGDITDEAGNTAELTLPLPYSANNQWEGIYFDTDAPVWSSGELNATPKKQQDGSPAAELTWPSVSDATSGLDLSGSYYIYRDGILIKRTNATTYTDTEVPEGSYKYTVKACDKAGNESESLTADITIADTVTESCSVDITAQEGFSTVSGDTANSITAEKDLERADISITVTDRAAASGGVPQSGVTVLWTHMRGNKMVAYGSAWTELTQPSDDSAGAPSATRSFILSSVEKGDTVNVFIIKDPLQLIKGTLSRILNIHG